MDLNVLDARLESGEELQVTYRYPMAGADPASCDHYRTRTDRLLAVEPSNGRMFVSFRGEVPVWIETDEVLKIEP